MRRKGKVAGVLTTVTLAASLAAVGTITTVGAAERKPTMPAMVTSSKKAKKASGSKSLQKVSIGLTSYNSLHLWVIVAKDQGLMKRFGVTFQPEVFTDVADIVPGVISGSLDFGLSTPEGTFAAQNKGGAVKIVALENVENPYQVITPKTVKSVSDLKGATVAVDSIGVSADYVTAVTLFRHAGLSTSEYHFINGGSPASRVAGLLSGTIKATLNFPPGTQQLTSQGMKVLLNAATEPYFKGIDISNVLADPTWYDAHRAVAVDFMKGYLASLKFLYNPKDKSKVIADIAKTMKVTTKDATDTYTFMVTKLAAEAKTPVVKLANVEKEIKNDTSAGVTGLPSPTKATLDKRIDNSLIEAAKR